MQKRFVSVLLAIAIIIAVFPLPADADTNTQFSIYYRVVKADGTVGDRLQKPIEEGFLVTSGCIGIQIDGFQYRPVNNNYRESFYFTFRLSGYNYNGDVFSLNHSNSAQSRPGSAANVTNINIRTFASGRGNEFLSNSNNWGVCQKTVTFTLRGISKVSSYNAFDIMLDTPFQILTTAENLYWYPYFDDLYFELDNQSIHDYYDSAGPLLQSMNAIMAQIRQVVLGVYQFQTISYNTNTGTMEVSSSSGNWFEAMLGALSSLNADAAAQAAQQQKAESAGAGDALDGAFDRVGSGFGSLGDVGDIGGLAPYNDNAIGNASNGLLHWFSEACRQSIDSVPTQRSAGLDIVDFYHGQVSELEEVLSDDSTDP